MVPVEADDSYGEGQIKGLGYYDKSTHKTIVIKGNLLKLKDQVSAWRRGQHTVKAHCDNGCQTQE